MTCTGLNVWQLVFEPVPRFLRQYVGESPHAAQQGGADGDNLDPQALAPGGLHAPQRLPTGRAFGGVHDWPDEHHGAETGAPGQRYGAAGTRGARYGRLATYGAMR